MKLKEGVFDCTGSCIERLDKFINHVSSLDRDMKLFENRRNGSFNICLSLLCIAVSERQIVDTDYNEL